jgi:REP element-mobilizing transposase RayT
VPGFRNLRVEIEGGVFHVYNRVASGEPVFSDPNEAAEFIETIHETKRRDGWTVFAWCVMSNHYHLVIRTATVPLWRAMHRIQNLYSRRFNKRHGRTGGLWQSRYKAKYVEDESYLGRLVLYVHLNPVVAGVVDDPAEYVFGGHREIKKQARSALVDIDETLLCFGPTRKDARRSYLCAIRAGYEPDEEKSRLTWHPFDAEGDETLDVADSRQTIDILGRSTDVERPTLQSRVFVELVCNILDVDMAHVSSRRRDRAVAAVRRLIVTLGVERWRQNRTELAKVLEKNPDVISWWAGEGAALRGEDSEFAAEMGRADEALVRISSKLALSERLGQTS